MYTVVYTTAILATNVDQFVVKRVVLSFQSISANEELEFDLYDYGQAYTGEDIKEPMINNNWDVDDFSMSDLGTTKLFPSNDTMVITSEVRTNSEIFGATETQLNTRKDDYESNTIESITSELTPSIISEINIPTSQISKPESQTLKFGTLKTPNKNQNIQDQIAAQRNVRVKCMTKTIVQSNNVEELMARDGENSLPPVTLIEELELWDEE